MYPIYVMTVHDNNCSVYPFVNIKYYLILFDSNKESNYDFINECYIIESIYGINL